MHDGPIPASLMLAWGCFFKMTFSAGRSEVCERAPPGASRMATFAEFYWAAASISR